MLVSTFTDYTQEIHNKFKTSLFKYESICGNIFCTSRREGDSIRPAGRDCGKSLKKLFTELKYTREMIRALWQFWAWRWTAAAVQSPEIRFSALILKRFKMR